MTPLDLLGFLIIIKRTDNETGDTCYHFPLFHYEIDWDKRGGGNLARPDNLASIFTQDPRVYTLTIPGTRTRWERDPRDEFPDGEKPEPPPPEMLARLFDGSVLEIEMDHPDEDDEFILGDVRLVTVAHAAGLFIGPGDDLRFYKTPLDMLRRAWGSLQPAQRVEQRAALPPWTKEVIFAKLLAFYSLETRFQIEGSHVVRDLMLVLYPAALCGF